METTGVQKRKRVHKYMRHISCISQAMEPTGVLNSTNAGSSCNYPAHFCSRCVSGGTYTRLGSTARTSCTARFVPLYKQRTHQLSDAPRGPGRSGQPVGSVCRSRRCVVGRSAGRSGRSIGSVGRRLVGRAAGRLFGRSASRTGRSVHPVGPSIRPSRLGGRPVGGTGRTLKQA